MKSKRTQQDIIVTVLLVLIALAAVALIATFVVRNVRENTTTAQNQADCLKVMLSIPTATAGATTVGVKREAGGEDLKGLTVKVIVAGTAQTSAPELGGVGTTTAVTTTALVKGDKVEAAVILGNSFTCSTIATATVA